MSEIIDRIRLNFGDAVIKRCAEKDCILKLNSLNNYVALKGELLCSDSRKMCDCIIFKANGNIIIGVIELKGKNPDAGEVIEKLTNGYKVALDIIEIISSNVVDIELYILILAKGWDPSQLKKINRSKIEIKGKKYEIRFKRCGISFYDVIMDR